MLARLAIAVCFLFLAQPVADKNTIEIGGLRWRRINPGTTDLSPISSQTQLAPTDLRSPSGFEGLYQLDSGPGAGTPGIFVRINAGMAAVFRRSVYTPVTPGVSLAEIPPDTVFVPLDALRKTVDSMRGTPAADVPNSGTAPLDLRVQIQERPIPPASSVARASKDGPCPIWTSEIARVRRVCELLDAARRAR